MENNETNVPRIIAMANMKGGVGKTTSTICTAIALNKLGRKVEVRDIDPQGSATLWAAKARAAGEPLPFDVRVANRFTVTMPPSDPDTWVLIDTPPSQSDLIAAADGRRGRHRGRTRTRPGPKGTDGRRRRTRRGSHEPRRSALTGKGLSQDGRDRRMDRRSDSHKAGARTGRAKAVSR